MHEGSETWSSVQPEMPCSGRRKIMISHKKLKLVKAAAVSFCKLEESRCSPLKFIFCASQRKTTKLNTTWSTHNWTVNLILDLCITAWRCKTGAPYTFYTSVLDRCKLTDLQYAPFMPRAELLEPNRQVVCPSTIMDMAVVKQKIPGRELHPDSP